MRGMLNLKPHKRICYIPGIISLLVIPLVFWYYGTHYIEKNDFRMLGLNMPPKNYLEDEFTAELFKDLIYNDVNVLPNFSDKTESEYLNLVRDLQEKNINKTAIRFHLSEQNTYGDLVKLLNIMEKTEQPRYGLRLDENTFEVIHIKPVDENSIICGTSWDSDIVLIDDSKFDIKEFLQKLPGFSYILLIGYLIMIICAIFKPKIFIPF